MKFDRVSIEEFVKQTEIWIQKYSEYMDKLANINTSENEDIKTLVGDDGKFSEFEKKYPEKVKEYREQRIALKAEYGEYSSYYNCPYYCVATTKEDIEEIYDKCYSNSSRDEHSSYQHNMNAIDKWVGKKLQDEYNADVYGMCLGIAFFMDEDYYLISDERTKMNKFALNVRLYNPTEHRSFQIVENGKDYL